MGVLCKVMQSAYLFALGLGAMLLLDELKVELFLLFLVELLKLLLQRHAVINESGCVLNFHGI